MTDEEVDELLRLAGFVPHTISKALRVPITNVVIENAKLREYIKELQKCIMDAPVGVATNGERIAAWLHERNDLTRG